MADFTAIASVDKSLDRFLSVCFAAPLVPAPVPGSTTKAVLARIEDFTVDGVGLIVPPALCHRASDGVRTAARRSRDVADADSPGRRARRRDSRLTPADDATLVPALFAR